MKKNGILTLLFAFIPGAGQMYQGYMKRGLSLVLMAAAISMAKSRCRVFLFILGSSCRVFIANGPSSRLNTH